MNSYFLHRAPSPTCYPTWGHWGHPGKCHQQPLLFTLKGIYILHNLTVLLKLQNLENEVCKFAQFWPLGALPLISPHFGNMYHMMTFESPAPKDDSCHVWLKSNHAFSK